VRGELEAVCRRPYPSPRKSCRPSAATTNVVLNAPVTICVEPCAPRSSAPRRAYPEQLGTKSPGIKSPAEYQLNLVRARTLSCRELPQQHAVVNARLDFVRAAARPVVLWYGHFRHGAILLNDDSHDDLARECRVCTQSEFRVAVLEQLLPLPDHIPQHCGRESPFTAERLFRHGVAGGRVGTSRGAGILRIRRRASRGRWDSAASS
jgi:hypothetical protein